MKSIKYLLLLVGMSLILPSCFDDSTIIDDIKATPNLVGFDGTSSNLSAVADGEVYEFLLPMKLFGPTTSSVSGSITATVSVDPSSTAIAGTHFNLPSNQITLTKEGDYLGNFTIEMLTEGIQTPLAKNPVVVLNVESISASGNVVASGRQIKVSLLYLCPSTLAGSYSVSGRYVRSSQGIDQTFSYTDTWVSTGLGSYRTTYVGHWAPSDLGGEPGMDLIEVCGAITIPSQNLVNLYSNIVEGVAGKSMVVDEVTGTIYLEYTICASDCREYFVTYVRQ